MHNDSMTASACAAASCGSARDGAEDLRAMGMYHAVLRDKDGNIKWEEDFANLVTDVGAKLMLDTIFAGSAYTAATYVGLKGTGTAAVGDTQASHAGWSEVGGTNAPAYSGARKTFAWSAASGTGAGSRTKSSSGTFTFTFTSGGTVDGAFLNINGSATVDNTTGTLFSAGTFSGGSKTVAASDTLTVTYSLSV